MRTVEDQTVDGWRVTVYNDQNQLVARARASTLAKAQASATNQVELYEMAGGDDYADLWPSVPSVRGKWAKSPAGAAMDGVTNDTEAWRGGR